MRRIGERHAFGDARDGERNPQATGLSPELRACVRNSAEQLFRGLRTPPVPVALRLRPRRGEQPRVHRVHHGGEPGMRREGACGIALVVDEDAEGD